MAFVNAKPDAPIFTEKTTEEKNDILRAFATGSTIETISSVTGIPEDDILTFLDNRVDEIIALKDFYSKVMTPVEAEMQAINERAVHENDGGKKRS